MINNKTSLFHKSVLYFGIVFCCLFYNCDTLYAQTDSITLSKKNDLLQIKFAGYMESVDSPGIKLRKLVGNVQMFQNDVALFCDSAYFYTAENRVKAMGNVIIEQGDSVQISCQKMNYDGNKEKAVLIGDAVLTDGSTQVSSERLDYNINSKYGYYLNGGSVINEETSLTSQKAYYYGATKDVIYKDSVLLINPKYQLRTDSLNHNLDTEIATYFGPSEVITEDNTIVGDGGYFDMKNNTANFGNRTKIYGDSYIEADSLYYNGAENISRAYGNAIIQKDSLYVEADTVFYNQQSNEGEAYGQAYVNNKDSEIMGDQLFFNDETGKGEAYGNAYFANETSEIEGDTILFNRETGQANVLGRAYIINEETQLSGENVFFNEQTGFGEITGNAIMVNENGSTIWADTLQFNREKGEGFAHSNILFKDTAQKISISSNYLQYREADDFVLATKNPFLIYQVDKDSLYIKADTLITTSTTTAPKQDSIAIQADTLLNTTTIADPSDSSRSFIAYKNVQVFKSDMQSVCDSLFYSGSDSAFYFHNQPIVWVNESQLIGDTIQLHTSNNQLDSVNLINNAIIGTTTFPGLFDQVKGQYITGQFKKGNISDMFIYNNAESIYFIKNEAEAFTAVNEASSDTMQVIFDTLQQVNKIKFISEANATLNPIDKVQPFQLKLNNFKWQAARRPKLIDFESYLNLF